MNEMTIDSTETKEKQGAAASGKWGLLRAGKGGGDEKTTQAPCPQCLEAPGYAVVL